jgi:hypothetical protein
VGSVRRIANLPKGVERRGTTGITDVSRTRTARVSQFVPVTNIS